MGTQQILMIVLSVIVVGAAVAVGIQMFDTQANNAARNAMVTDVLQMAAQAQAWYRTPTMMGGAGNAATNSDDGGFTATDIAKYIDSGATTATITNANGSYVVAIVTWPEISIVATQGEMKVAALIDLKGVKGDNGIKMNPSSETVPTF